MWKNALISLISLVLVMVVMIVLMMGLMLVAMPCFAADFDQKGWNGWDTGLLILQVTDYSQTTWACDQNYKFIIPQSNGSYRPIQEENPILGPHPSQSNIDCYFAVLFGCDYLIATRANPKLHKLWDIIEITAETYCVTHNWQIGIGFKY